MQEGELLDSCGQFIYSVPWRHLLIDDIFWRWINLNYPEIVELSLCQQVGDRPQLFLFPLCQLKRHTWVDPCLAFSHLLQVLPLHTSHTNQMSHNSLIVSYHTGVAMFFTWARFFSFLRLTRQCFHLDPFLESVTARRFLPTHVFSLLLAACTECSHVP